MFNKEITQKIREFQPFYETELITDLFSWNELESLLNLRPFTNKKRFITTDDATEDWQLSTRLRFYSSWLTDYESYPPEIIQYFIKNSVCYLRDCSRVNKKINSICGELEQITKRPADAHIYFCLTDNLKSGFGSHWDNQHNLIVQVEGKTHFRIWDKTNNFDSNRVNEPKQNPLIDVVVTPGDVVFVPAHYVHCATSLMKRLSVSFPMTNNPGDLQQSRNWISLLLN
jgi:hypothetical protein